MWMSTVWYDVNCLLYYMICGLLTVWYDVDCPLFDMMLIVYCLIWCGIPSVWYDVDCLRFDMIWIVYCLIWCGLSTVWCDVDCLQFDMMWILKKVLKGSKGPKILMFGRYIEFYFSYNFDGFIFFEFVWPRASVVCRLILYVSFGIHCKK